MARTWVSESLLWGEKEETAMKRLRLTSGHGLYFFSQAQHLALLQAVGFEATVTRLDGWWPYPHLLYVCRPCAAAEGR